MIDSIPFIFPLLSQSASSALSYSSVNIVSSITFLHCDTEHQYNWRYQELVSTGQLNYCKL